MNKGDIILIPFPFSDLSGNKNKPELKQLKESIKNIIKIFKL